MAVDIQTYRFRIGSFSFTSCKTTNSTGNDSRIKDQSQPGRNSVYLRTITFVIVLCLSSNEYHSNQRHIVFGLPHDGQDTNKSTLGHRFPVLERHQKYLLNSFKLSRMYLTVNNSLECFLHISSRKSQPCAQTRCLSLEECINKPLEYFTDRDVGSNEVWYMGEQILPIKVIQIQLLISGVEPNPGPGFVKDLEANTQHSADTAPCDSEEDVTLKSASPFNGNLQATTNKKLDEKKQTRKTDVHLRKVQPCTGSIKVGSLFGTKVFKIELNDDLRKGLLNKNYTKAKEFAISRILDELCNFGAFVELDIPPLFYLRKKIAYMVLPSSSWWGDLDFTTDGTIPAAVLAYRNEFRESFFFRDRRTLYLLDEHICNNQSRLSSINFCDITVTNPFGGFHLLTCNSTYMYPNEGNRHDKHLNQPELKYPTQVSEAQQQHDSSVSEEETFLDEHPSTSHQNDTSLSVNQTGTFRHDNLPDSSHLVQIDRPHVQINMAFRNPGDDEMRFNQNNTERVQYMATSIRGQQRRFPTAKYASYENVGSRRETYRGWPLQQPDPQTLCNAGFFFTGQSYDLVRCFCCGIGLKDFSDADNPLLEHAKHSGNCPFLLEQFGSREALEIYKQNNTRPDPEEIRRRQRELYQQQQGRPVTNYRAKHERFRSLSSRLDTFISWPPNLSQRPEQLAAAGLYYTGVDDHCRCFACDGGLRKWEPGDEPWIEHCRWFPACPYAREVKGDEFINLIQLSADQAASETTSGQNEEMNGAMAAVTIDDRLVQRIVEKHRHMITYDMGFPEDDVRNAVLELVQQGTGDPDIEEIVTRMEVIRERKSLDENLITQPPPCPQSTETLMEQNQRLKSILLCHVCHKNQINALFLPCTHHKYCFDCTQANDRCPDCGRPIKERIRTFMG
ncbi:uncharacterized protein LOC127851280 isoform X2 [Dreissena polymorpha]|uniref:uncharacterized protein LOC127851280 isoform X2 n=1 Tax=Dreissena polymorpha TaxID=45954 RepID=UPI00226461E0|nr:uncharacterized protein LOC127851280 isoform X2 [Dreissena polymorpha]